MEIRKSICNECPFSKGSLKGWLGGEAVEDTLNCMQFDQAFSCHMHRTEETHQGDIWVGDLPICRGFMMSAKKSCKMFGQMITVDSILLKDLQKRTDFSSEELEQVLSKQEFRKHHTLNPNT